MIDRGTIIAMAREAGGLPDPMVFIGAYERFAARVAAHEREACAQVCDEEASRSETSMLKAKTVKARDIYSSAGQTAHWMAQAIRARGNHAGG